MLDYRTAGPLTDVSAHAERLADLPADPVELCRTAQGLVIEPHDALPLGVPEERQAEKDLRKAGAMLAAVVAQGATTLSEPAEPSQRVLGTCRHFATMACALLRFRGIPARARCGFAGYFVPDSWVDHWIIEHRDGDGQWVRTDPEVMQPDLAPGQFLTGGEAWALARTGDVDPQRFGVFGVPDNWGLPEIQGNAVRDLAALVKVEMLPWDAWGRMDEAYERRTGPDYDELLDRLAEVCATGSDAEVLELSDHADLAVPAELVG
jgi:Transglutaminase-like superfamily